MVLSTLEKDVMESLVAVTTVLGVETGSCKAGSSFVMVVLLAGPTAVVVGMGRFK